MSTRLSTEELDALVKRLQGAADYRREFGPSEGVAIYVLASDAIEQLRESDARARRALRDLTAALPDPDKLDFIAEHLDLTDKIWMDVAEKQGNEGARAVFNGVEMQRDLRRWAEAARAVFVREGADVTRLSSEELARARIEAAARAGWEWECERLDDFGGVWEEMDPTLRQNLLDVCGVMLAAADVISGAEESDG